MWGEPVQECVLLQVDVHLSMSGFSGIMSSA